MASVQRQFGSRPKCKRGLRTSGPDIRECCPHCNPPSSPQSEEKWKSLEERLCTIKGGDKYGLEAVDLCLVPNVGLPADFKTPEFDKYKGSSCPRVHLAIYCRKMAAYVYDDKDSLTGAALSWYVSLKRGCIKTLRDLVEAFLKQYKYNEDMAPN
ncbi:hypothetical protein CR513_05637, partial [Mucuna pruriens]